MPDFSDHMLTGISNVTSAADDHSLDIPLILIIDLSVYKFRHQLCLDTYWAWKKRFNG